MEYGQLQLGGTGAIDVRLLLHVSYHVDEAEPIVFYITNINKDSFSYTVRRCDNGQYTPQIDDKLNWIAIAD